VPFRRVVLIPLVIALSLLAPGCGGDSGDDPPAGRIGDSTAQVRYLAMGDSLTQGVGAENIETGAFPARLAERWRDAGCTVDLNIVGISGYTAGQILDEQVPQIKPFDPTVITFQTGANDIANGVTEDDYRDNIGEVLDAALDSGARVYVLLQNEWFRSPSGPDYGGTAELRAAYDAIMIEEAESRDVEILDLRPIYKQQADDDEWIDDGLHPTDEAYDAWAEALAEMIPLPCES